MSKYGVKVSRPGYNVKSSEDADLVFSTVFNTLKAFKVLHFDYDAGRSPMNIDSQLHGLDYAPTFLVLSEDSVTSGRWSMAISDYFGGGASQVFVDTTSVYYNQSEACYVILFIDPLDAE